MLHLFRFKYIYKAYLKATNVELKCCTIGKTVKETNKKLINRIGKVKKKSDS